MVVSMSYQQKLTYPKCSGKTTEYLSSKDGKSFIEVCSNCAARLTEWVSDNNDALEKKINETNSKNNYQL